MEHVMNDDKIIERALQILASRLKFGAALTSPGAVRDYLRLTLGGREHEVFVCIWVDAQHRVIAIEEAFRGTLTQTSVYPREIVKSALAHNAAQSAYQRPQNLRAIEAAEKACRLGSRKSPATVALKQKAAGAQSSNRLMSTGNSGAPGRI
jgi:RadC-like JAB domain